MSISLAKNSTLFSSKQVLTRAEAIQYLHKHMGYTLNSAKFNLVYWTKIKAIPSQLREKRRYYALSDLLKFSDPKDRRRLVKVAKWKRLKKDLYEEFAKVGEKQRKEALFKAALEPIPEIEKDLMLQQMKTYTGQLELPLNPVARLNALPLEERKKAFTKLYMTTAEIHRDYFTDGKELAELVRSKKLDRIKVRANSTRSTKFAYPRDQIASLLQPREQEILILM